MISGIMIEGQHGWLLAKVGEWVPTGGNREGDRDVVIDHRAYSVGEDPYIETDFDKSGESFLPLVGTQSN